MLPVHVSVYVLLSLCIYTSLSLCVNVFPFLFEFTISESLLVLSMFETRVFLFLFTLCLGNPSVFSECVFFSLSLFLCVYLASSLSACVCAYISISLSFLYSVYVFLSLSPPYLSSILRALTKFTVYRIIEYRTRFYDQFFFM